MTKYMQTMNKIIIFATVRGITIKFNVVMEDDVLGYINFLSNEIFIKKGSDSQTLITLLHELGHWLAYTRATKRYGYDSHRNNHVRKEIDAYRYGFYLSKLFNTGLTKQEWRSNHKSEIKIYNAIYGNIPCWTPRIMMPRPCDPVELWLILGIYATIPIILLMIIHGL